jgi:hypothetical protein
MRFCKIGFKPLRFGLVAVSSVVLYFSDFNSEGAENGEGRSYG